MHKQKKLGLMTRICLSFDIHHFEIEELLFLTLWWDFRKEASIWHRFRLLILTRLAGLAEHMHLGIVNNKVGWGVVAHARRYAQTDSSALKLTMHLSLLSRTCVLGLCQDPAPHPKMIKRRVAGGGVQDSRSIQPRIRKAHLLITHVLDSCVKLLAVLHISSAQGRSVDRTSTGSS